MMDIQSIVEQMIRENLSIREMSAIIKVPKSTLFARIKRYKNRLDLEVLEHYEALMEANKITMHLKGGKATQVAYKGKKKCERKKENE